MNNKVLTVWTKNLKDQKEKEEFVTVLKHSPRVLRRLNEIIDESMQELVAKEESEDSFDIPNWHLYQANILGQRKAYKKIKQLLAFLNKRA